MFLGDGFSGDAMLADVPWPQNTAASLENSGEIMRIMAWFRAKNGQVRHFSFLANFMKQ